MRKLRPIPTLALLLMLGCGGAEKAAWDAKLAQGCNTEEACERLFAEAKARKAKCHPNTIGRIRCEDAYADLVQIHSALESIKRQKQAEERAREQREREARDQEARNAYEYEKAQREERENERKAQALERLEIEWKTLAPRKCALEGDPPACLDLKRFIPRAAGTPMAEEAKAALEQGQEMLRERQKLEAERLNKEAEAEARRQEEAARRQEGARRQRSDGAGSSAPSGAGAPLKCCDGTFSPTCVVGGKRRGCCSHHGGICN